MPGRHLRNDGAEPRVASRHLRLTIGYLTRLQSLPDSQYRCVKRRGAQGPIHHSLLVGKGMQDLAETMIFGKIWGVLGK